MATPFISLCIPTYKRVHYLTRLFESILIQTFKDFDIVITDNSDDDSVKNLVDSYRDRLDISYHKNEPPVSMAENWNANAERATGKWLKMIHDDDYFADATALEKYADVAKSENVDFIAGGYQVYYEQTRALKSMLINERTFRRFTKYPYYLFASNVIGPPSVMMVRREKVKMVFDTRLTWRVDVDFYMRALSMCHAMYIREHLISVSHNVVQTTNQCFNNVVIEIPESLIFYEKFGSRIVRPIRVYDAWWRLMRNLNIRDIAEVEKYAGGMPIPLFLRRIVGVQSRLPVSWLKNRWVSKICMTSHYCIQVMKGTL